MGRGRLHALPPNCEGGWLNGRGSLENHPVIGSVSPHTTVGVLLKISADLYVHRDNGVNDENTELSFGKWVVPQNMTIGGGSLSG